MANDHLFAELQKALVDLPLPSDLLETLLADWQRAPVLPVERYAHIFRLGYVCGKNARRKPSQSRRPTH